jgi:serine/threonine protein kinase/tetratricopeptide (TPR) repeat protein
MELNTVSHYRILEKLGAGGMGEVYLAEDMKLGRKVAIKILTEEYTTNRDRLHRFEQEASAASALNHPNILTIHEVGQDQGRHFIATEYIDGVTLRRKMSAGHFEMAEILDIAVQVASALEEAHSAGIIHRDIKPDNIMVRRNGYVKVLDFGLAKLTESLTDRTPSDGEAATRVLVQTDAGVVMGTSHYMSPEQARGKQVDARSDIWSLGVVIYEMVAGRTPFEGETSTDVIVAITQKEPLPLVRFAPNVPAELDWIVTKALRKDREERYQTIKELLTDLRRIKQRLEFENELQKSAAPESFTRSSIDPVAAVPTEAAHALATAEKSVSHVSSAEYIVTGIKRHRVAALVVALVVIAAVGASAYFYTKRTPTFTDKDTILLTDFVNTTGETVFDGTLKQALTVQLGQTPFLNIFPEERVRETLRFMGKSPEERITRDVGREICERQGIKALLSGSIASLGSHYIITLEALNARTGDPIAREQIEAESKEKVLSSLGTAASNLRQKLGESLSSIKKYDVAIEQATTSSLEALKAFAMGNEARGSGRPRESLTFYQKAVELDPNFAMAYARIAVFYGNQAQVELAKEYVRKAFDLRDRVSEREKLYITEKYHNYVTGDLDKAIEVLQAWATQYPNDYIPHNNLALNFRFIGRNEESLKESLKAVELSPTNTSARDNLIASFFSLGRLDEAAQATDELAKLNPESPSVYFNRYLLAFHRGDNISTDALLARFKGKPEEPDVLDQLSAFAAYYGKLKESQALIVRARDMYKSQQRNENVAQIMIGLAERQSFMGKCQEAKQNVAAALSVDRGRITLAGAGLATAACNDAAQAQSLIDEMLKQYPENTPTIRIVIPIMKALLALNRGDGAEAIQILEPLRSYEVGFISGVSTLYLRGHCYLQQKMGPQAAAEFEKILSHPGVDDFSMLHVLAHLGLARAAVLMNDQSRARKEYQDFLALWKDADQDLPPVVEAKKEYAGLTR